MIKTISSNGHITITGGSPSARYINNNGLLNGSVRYNNGNFEVFDGSSWMNIEGSHAFVTLSAQANDAISWALEKMMEEQKIRLAAKLNPAIQAAYENFKRSEEQLKTTIILSNNEPTS